MPVYVVLKISHIVIGTTSIIEGSDSRYIVRRVTIMSRGLFSVRLSFFAIFFPKDVPDCFTFSPIKKCAVWTWRLTKLPLCFRSELLRRYELSIFFSTMGNFFPASLLALVQPTFLSHVGSVKPSIFVVVITMSMLYMIRLEVDNYKIFFIQVSGVLCQWGSSKRKIIISWDVKCFFCK